MKKAHTSATVMASQIPSIPRNTGRISTDSIWNTRVLRKATAADTPPLLRAVKKEDTKILIPAKIKEKENT